MDRAGAISALEQARLAGPTVEGLLTLALAYHLAGDVGAEVSAAEAATKLDPDSRSAWVELRPRARADRPHQRVPRRLPPGAGARRRSRGGRPAGASRGVAAARPVRAQRSLGAGRTPPLEQQHRRLSAIEPSRPHTGQDSPAASGRPPHPGQFSTPSSTPSSSPTRQTSSRSSSTSIHTPADAGNTTWSPGRTGIAIPTFSHQSSPGPTASTMPCCGGGSSEPGGTISPERRTRSGSSSLITTRSNRGRSWLRMAGLMSPRIGAPWLAAVRPRPRVAECACSSPAVRSGTSDA